MKMQTDWYDNCFLILALKLAKLNLSISMKLIIPLFLLLTTSAFGQKTRSGEKKLNDTFAKINYWASYQNSDDKISPMDSAWKYDSIFSKMLLKYTATNPETIHYNFDALEKNGMRIVTSEDGNFRIYSWDDETGGTMRRFNQIYQFRDGKKVMVKSNENNQEGAGSAFYTQINDVISGNKTFYVTQSVSILSSALSYHNIKIFSIEHGQLNDKAVLIKTKTGIRNQLGYEVDLSSKANRDQDTPDYSIVYDKKAKILAIPLIKSDGEVTAQKIRYQFKGKFFEKL